MKLVREHINEITLGGSHLTRMGVGVKAIKSKICKTLLNICHQYDGTDNVTENDVIEFLERFLENNPDISPDEELIQEISSYDISNIINILWDINLHKRHKSQ